MKLFEGLSFFLDEDVNVEVKVFIENEGGLLVGDEPPDSYRENFYWLVNQRYLRVNKDDPCEPRECPVVLHQWVNACIIKQRLVDMDPFLVSVPPVATAAVNKKAKVTVAPTTTTTTVAAAVRYTADEDDKLWTFSRANEENEYTQEQLWSKAERMNLLPERTARSMQNRFQTVKAKHLPMDATYRHYSTLDDLELMSWAFCWHHYKRKDYTMHMWEAAESKCLLLGRKASQMESRYKKVLAMHKGGAAQTLGENNVSTQHWLDFFIVV